jgi:hypothetical protein
LLVPAGRTYGTQYFFEYIGSAAPQPLIFSQRRDVSEFPFNWGHSALNEPSKAEVLNVVIGVKPLIDRAHGIQRASTI